MSDMYRTRTMDQISEGDIGAQLKIAGWVENIRDHGGVSFIDLRDMYGVMQVVLRDTSLLDHVRKEECLSVEGVIQHRDEETFNPKIPTGTIELEAHKIDILGKVYRDLPFEIATSKEIREIYDNGDSLIMVATDRISCFDVILKNDVTKKGTVLTQMSKFWFDLTKDIVPNHMISVDVKDMPEFFQQEKYDGNSMMCKKLTMLPIECIVRGYITGSGWASYQENGTVCGIKLPEGLKESDKLPEPIYTPSTKAEIGDHDENISFERSIEVLEKEFPGKGQEYAEQLRDKTIALYKKCADYALEHGIIIADTKFEFGLDENGNIVIGDEMLTPDSSRFWPADEYEPGHGQPSFDKQFARDWLKSNEHDWKLPQDIVDKTIDKYFQAYEMLTGKDL